MGREVRGADLGHPVGASVFFRYVEPGRLERLFDGCLEAYLTGLEEQRRRSDPADVEFAVGVTTALRALPILGAATIATASGQAAYPTKLSSGERRASLGTRSAVLALAERAVTRLGD